ncbi:unnamed protein product [Brassica oleracea]|uniref:Uncharacterized protein n=2 Tax=Brassica oleracea TaxID=3712 RepID=A0A0D3AQB1_BRAOL|nr:unnamed protein product [Brassica oleracea]
MNPMFYFLLASTAVLATTANASEPVVDADGDLISDGSYYAVPVSPTMTNKGLALKSSNWGSWAEFVPESENLNIEMNVPSTICGQSSYCWLTETHGKGLLFIAAGPKPETGKDSSKSFFQTRKLEIFFAVTSLRIVVTIRAATNLGRLWTDMAITVWLQPICHSSLSS